MIALLCKTEEFFLSLGLPVGQAQLGQGKLSAQEQEDLAQRCSYGRTRTIGSFVKLDFADIKQIYIMANGV